MEDLLARRARPFAIVAVATAIVCIAMIRLPESFLSLIERKTSFTSAQTGWAYRLLVVAAVAQALYGGFMLLRPDRIEAARRKDPKLARLPRGQLTGVVARTAASMVAFTVVYGLAAFGISGQRGGFWLFPVLAVAQGGWYYHQLGQVATWMGFQPEAADEPDRGRWQREPPDYCPPLVRGLAPMPRTHVDT